MKNDPGNRSPMTRHTEIIELFERFIEEEDDRVIHTALPLLDDPHIDIVALLDHLENFRGDFARKRRAIALIRKQVGLPLIPGPVCRNAP